MPPPTHMYTKGSKEYQSALKTGHLEVSLPTITADNFCPPTTPSSTLNLELQFEFGSPPALFNPPPIVSPPEYSLQSEEPPILSNHASLDAFGNEQSLGSTLRNSTFFLSNMSGYHKNDDNTDMEFDRESLPQSSPDDVTITSCEQPREPQNLGMEETRFADIVGHGSAKLHMEELLLPLALPAEVADAVFTGARAMPASVLLYGPPGCGKVRVRSLECWWHFCFFIVPKSHRICLSWYAHQTQLARAMAGEASAAFVQVAPSDILSKFVGESEAAVRSIFKKAVNSALLLESKCAVVFFDEIDSLGQSRDDRGSGEGEGCSRRVLAELLMVMSEITDRKSRSSASDFDTGKDDDVSIDDNVETTTEHARVIVIAATNRIFDLDPALKRRFGIQLPIDPPGKRERKEMLRRHLNGIDYAISNEDMDHLSKWLDGWTGSDLSSLVREAVMTPVRECLRKAARMRKRPARRKEQSGGDTSGQEDSAGPAHPDVDAKVYLLNAIKTLRSVSIEDFVHAIQFLQPDITTTATPFPDQHYDSSSDEDI